MPTFNLIFAGYNQPIWSREDAPPHWYPMMPHGITHDIIDHPVLVTGSWEEELLAQGSSILTRILPKNTTVDDVQADLNVFYNHHHHIPPPPHQTQSLPEHIENIISILIESLPVIDRIKIRHWLRIGYRKANKHFKYIDVGNLFAKINYELYNPKYFKDIKISYCLKTGLMKIDKMAR